LTSFSGGIWLSGGDYTVGGSGPGSYIKVLKDVWHSSDGASWDEVNDTLYPPHSGHTCVAFQDKLWFLGGYDQHIECRNDVWCLAPGEIPDVSIHIVANHGSWYERGEQMHLSVEGTGITDDATYEWYRDGETLADHDDEYDDTYLASYEAGAYTCKVTVQGRYSYATDAHQVVLFPQDSLPIRPGALACLGAALLLFARGKVRAARD